jgi:hypothetical protein
LRPVDWAGAPFSQLEVLPKNHQPITTWDNPDEAFREIAEGIRAVAMDSTSSGRAVFSAFGLSLSFVFETGFANAFAKRVLCTQRLPEGASPLLTQLISV